MRWCVCAFPTPPSSRDHFESLFMFRPSPPSFDGCLSSKLVPAVFPTGQQFERTITFCVVICLFSPAIIAFSATVLTQFCLSGLCGLHLTLPVKGSVFKKPRSERLQVERRRPRYSGSVFVSREKVSLGNPEGNETANKI